MFKPEFWILNFVNQTYGNEPVTKKKSEIYQHMNIILKMSYANVSNLWAVDWSKVPLQLLVLLQMNEALCLGLLILELQSNCLQFLWVQLSIQGTHLPHRAGDKRKI